MKKIHFTANKSTKDFINGVDAWRIFNPYKYLKAKGYEVGLDNMTFDKDEFIRQFENFDVEHFSYHNILGLQKIHSILEKAGLVISTDIDDDLYHVDKKYGTDQEHWTDFVDGCHRITVTNQYLSQMLSISKRQRTGLNFDSTQYAILPNLIDFDIYQRKEKQEHKGIVVGYMGSAYHMFDFVESGFFNAIKQIMVKYPQVKFECFGMQAIENFPIKVSKMHPFKKDYYQYVKYFNKIAPTWDIGVAPLETNLFSMSKSNIKYLEYSALGITTIAQNYHPYFCVKDGETGRLADSMETWFDVLEELVNNEAERQRLAENAYKDVRENFSLDKKGYIYEQYFQNL